MGYTTDFSGTLKLNKQLSLDDKTFLDKLATTRRMKRDVAPEYGVDGEFYVEGEGQYGQDREDNIVEYNAPPRTQPSLWCQWVPTEDGWGLEWDGNEKFYDYIEWLQYIINWLSPKGYVVNGEVDWAGEDDDDRGTIVVVDNVVSTKAQGEDGDKATRVFFVVDSVDDNEELFETLEKAEMLAETMTNGRIRICVVRNVFKEDDGSWNYSDQSDTFKVISVWKEYK